MLANRSLSTKSATPNSRVLVSAKATPTPVDFAWAVAPGTEVVVASLMAITIGADDNSVFTNNRSSTAWRFPGDAYDERVEKYGRDRGRCLKAYLLLQLEWTFGILLPRGFLSPDLNTQLFGSQGFPEESRRLHLVHADRRKRVIPGSHVLNDGVGLEDMGSNIVSIRAIRRIKGSPVKEANRPRLGGFWREPAEEGTESRIDLL